MLVRLFVNRLFVCGSLTVTDNSDNDEGPKPSAEKKPDSKSAVWKGPVQRGGIHKMSEPHRQE
jgi:hypothetical protein